jgi:hypothetical protein
MCLAVGGVRLGVPRPVVPVQSYGLSFIGLVFPAGAWIEYAVRRNHLALVGASMGASGM